MKTVYFLSFLGAFLILSAPRSAEARLDETIKESDKRYGKPVAKETAYPLIRNAEHRVYHFEGWKIETAFVDDRAACMEYSKLRDPERSDTVVLQQGEIDKLLAAEAGGGSWSQEKEEASSNPFKALGKFVENTEKWKNSNGSTAELRQNKLILRVETPAAEKARQAKPASMSKF